MEVEDDGRGHEQESELLSPRSNATASSTRSPSTLTPPGPCTTSAPVRATARSAFTFTGHPSPSLRLLPHPPRRAAPTAERPATHPQLPGYLLHALSPLLPLAQRSTRAERGLRIKEALFWSITRPSAPRPGVCCPIDYYQVKWSTGSLALWSEPYLPGLNDLDVKPHYYGTRCRKWSYFDEHMNRCRFARVARETILGGTKMLENPDASGVLGVDRRLLNQVPVQGCDLIMKGGVTSGIVYPPAILKLAQHYRFYSIGGSSAGAIAAAATAAAEFGRQTCPDERRTGATHGFVRFAEMNDELAQPGFIRDLFQPSDEGRPLFDAFLQWKEQSAAAAREQAAAEENGRRPPGFIRRAARWGGRLGTILKKSVRKQHLAGRIVGLLGSVFLTSGLTAWCVAWLTGMNLWLQALGVVLLVLVLGACWLGSALGGLIWGGGALGRIVWRLQDKDGLKYGICPGSDGPDAQLDSKSLALTDWLHVRFNELAGLGPMEPPLTLSKLRECDISFKLVTSNLTLGQPYILPMRRGSRSFFFKKSEMARLFPPPVLEELVRWGKLNRPERAICIRDEDAEEFLRFPMGEDIPLVVATRLSLSFPVLLSAVRLYSIRTEAYVPLGHFGPPRVLDLVRDVEEHWLSDGGIVSNFPIHVFDTWVPLRPTFGITLCDSPLSSVLDQREANDARPVLLPRPRDFDKARPRRTAIHGVGDFLRAVFETAQSYRDNAQAGLPSYRERIVQIFLDKAEGGLNLDMPPKVVTSIQNKGQMAAHELLGRYPDLQGSSFAEHQWVRLQVLMAELERQLMEVRSIFPGSDWKDRLRMSFASLFEAQLEARKAGGEPWYRDQNEAWCKEASSRIGALLQLIEAWDTSHRAWQEACRGGGMPVPEAFFAEHPPRPQGMLKVAPDL